MQDKFTVEEFKNYVLGQDSLGDILFNLRSINIQEANNPKTDEQVFSEDVQVGDKYWYEPLSMIMEIVDPEDWYEGMSVMKLEDALLAADNSELFKVKEHLK